MGSARGETPAGEKTGMTRWKGDLWEGRRPAKSNQRKKKNTEPPGKELGAGKENSGGRSDQAKTRLDQSRGNLRAEQERKKRLVVKRFLGNVQGYQQGGGGCEKTEGGGKEKMVWGQRNYNTKARSGREVIEGKTVEKKKGLVKKQGNRRKGGVRAARI